MGDAFLRCAAVALPFLLLFWDWYYSCPQNPLTGKARGGLLQEIVPFFLTCFLLHRLYPL